MTAGIIIFALQRAATLRAPTENEWQPADTKLYTEIGGEGRGGGGRGVGQGGDAVQHESSRRQWADRTC